MNDDKLVARPNADCPKILLYIFWIICYPAAIIRVMAGVHEECDFELRQRAVSDGKDT